ncbi:MAG: 23S rRNA pseudouridine synthase [Parcubacteria bacterium C7867-008]|nr:MAG: 23S rRNA pseudouridine synthase [Parcubacteria bacterium C7867-008]
MNLPVIYEDDAIVAIDKPIGVMTHPDGHSTDETVSDWFAKHYPASAEVGETQRLQNGTEILRAGIVHRLDRDTSGVMILTKTPEAHAFYKEAFQEHSIQKTYLAFVYGTMKEEKGTINLPIGRSATDFRLRSAQRGSKGLRRDAITHYQVVGDIGTHSLIKAMPQTGRTHQIRVHLKAVHHPIVCDPLYAPNQKCDLGFKRLGLHAYKLELPLLSGESITITAPVPLELQAAIAMFPNTEDLL